MADFLGSMLKMETDDYVDTPANHGNGQQPDLLKMCRNRLEYNSCSSDLISDEKSHISENQVFLEVHVLRNVVVH